MRLTLTVEELEEYIKGLNAQIAQLKETISNLQLEISELEGGVVERDEVIDKLMENVDGLKAKGFDIDLKLKAEKLANHQLLSKQKELHQTISQGRELSKLEIDKNAMQKEIPSNNINLGKDDQNLNNPSTKVPEPNTLDGKQGSQTKAQGLNKNKLPSKSKANTKLTVSNGTSITPKASNAVNELNPIRSNKRRASSFTEFPGIPNYKLKKFATSIVEMDNETQTADKAVNTMQASTSNVGIQTHHYDDMAYEQVNNLRRSGVNEEEIINTLSRILERNRLAEITGVKQRVNTKKREVEAKTPMLILTSEEKDDFRRDSERSSELINIIKSHTNHESGFKTDQAFDIEKIPATEKNPGVKYAETTHLEHQSEISMNVSEAGNNYLSNQKVKAPKKPSNHRYNLSLDSRIPQTGTHIYPDSKQKNTLRKNNKANDPHTPRQEEIVNASPDQVASNDARFKTGLIVSPRNNPPISSKANPSTTSMPSPNSNFGKTPHTIMDGQLLMNKGYDHISPLLSNSPTPSLSLNSHTVSKMNSLKNTVSPLQSVISSSQKHFSQKGPAKDLAAQSITNLMRATAVNSNLTTLTVEASSESPRMTTRRTLAHVIPSNETALEAENHREIVKKRKMLLSNEIEDPDLEQQNEGLIAQMFEVMKEKTKTVPKIKKIFKPFVPSQLKRSQTITDRNQERAEDDEDDDEDDDFDVDFEVFKDYYKRMQKIHRKCGEDCIHLRRFYSKIGWYGPYSDRPYFHLKKKDIDKLPRIIRKVYV